MIEFITLGLALLSVLIGLFIYTKPEKTTIFNLVSRPDFPEGPLGQNIANLVSAYEFSGNKQSKVIPIDEEIEVVVTVRKRTIEKVKAYEVNGEAATES